MKKSTENFFQTFYFCNKLIPFAYDVLGGDDVNRKEILRALEGRIRRLRQRDGRESRIRLEEAERIRDAIRRENGCTRRRQRIDRLI